MRSQLGVYAPEKEAFSSLSLLISGKSPLSSIHTDTSSRESSRMAPPNPATSSLTCSTSLASRTRALQGGVLLPERSGILERSVLQTLPGWLGTALVASPWQLLPSPELISHT